jgi:hypothetical protein
LARNLARLEGQLAAGPVQFFAIDRKHS